MIRRHSSLGRSTVLALVALVLLLVAPQAFAQQGIAMETVAFSLEKKLYCLKVNDLDRGTYFSVRELKTGEKVQDYAYDLETEEKVWKQVKRTHALDDEPVIGQASPDGRFTLLGAPAKSRKGTKYEILVSGNGKVGLLMDIDLAVDERSKKTAVGALKHVAWDPKGKYVVLVVNQKLEGDFPVDRDYAYQTKFRSFRVKWR
jgi:hypothetical protein